MATRAALKSSILQQLNGSGTGVVLALTGPWGAGKTHLWRDIQQELEVRALYSSVFGVGSAQNIFVSIVAEAHTLKKPEGSTESPWRGKVKEKIVNIVPEALKAIDAKLGAQLLAKLIEPIDFVPEGSIICLDDIERAAETLPFSQILGMANVLAEKKKCRVLLIYNQDHLSERIDKSGDVAKAYRERVIHHSYALTADIPMMAGLLHKQKFENVSQDDLKMIVDTFVRLRVENIRTLHRVFEHVSELRRIAGDGVKPIHVLLATAWTMENVGKGLQEGEFYNYHPVIFAPQYRERVKEGEAQREQQSQFHQAYFSNHNSEYSFVPSIYTLVSEGVVDEGALKKDLLRGHERERSPVYQALSAYLTGELRYFSDSENRQWLHTAFQQIQDNNNLSAGILLQFHRGAMWAADNLEALIPAELRQLIEDRLFEAANNLDESISRAELSGWSNSKSTTLAFWYLASLDQARGHRLRETLLAYILDGNVQALIDSIQQNIHAFEAMLDPCFLERLHESRANRRLYFRVLLAMYDQAYRTGNKAAKQVLNDYLCAYAAFSQLESSDRFRLQVLFEHGNRK